MNSLSIIDCATETLSNNCYNRLVDYFNIPMKFHCPSMFGMSSLENDTASAYIVFGSYSNVEDELIWQKELAHFLNDKLLSGIPVLGICFAHQLMAKFYGAKVIRNIENILYEGVRKVKFNDTELSFFVSHSYQVTELPSCFERISKSKECDNEIIRHKELPLLSIQGHPEASDFFISTTLMNVHISDKEKEYASRDGLFFIENFLKVNHLL